MNILTSLKETLNKFWEMLVNLPEFMEGMKEELGRLTWPSWNDLIVGTAGVLAISAATTLFIWVSDMLVSRVFIAIIGMFGG